MRYIGLTGSMGAGKSTAAAILSELGAEVLCADQLAQQAVEPGQPAYYEIVDHFGAEIVLANSTLDRKKIASIVFHDKQQLEHLNKITHKQVRRLRDQFIRSLYRNSPDTLLIYDVPLLFETHMQLEFQRIILITIDSEIQLDRLMTNRQLTQSEIMSRLRNQMPQEKKQQLSDYVVDNSKSTEQLESKLKQVIREIDTLPQLTLAELF